MTRIRGIFIFISFIFCSCVQAQRVEFKDLSLYQAGILAKEKKKNILIDTYADWCIPCKKMDQEFRQSHVARFFNENFINVRINLDFSLNAREYRTKYDIVFLPTIIILDSFLNVKYKTDKYISGDELMEIGQKVLSTEDIYINDATPIANNPIGTNTIENKNEVIVHKLGDKNKNPDILMKEAYFRIELMDGSHRKAAAQYLETQHDWSSKKNMKFIIDFLYTTKSAEFIYITDHLQQFKDTLGEEEVKRSLEIVINDELDNGFPRPDFERTKILLSTLDDEKAEQNTYEYFFERCIDECNLKEFTKLVNEYLNRYHQDDKKYLADYVILCSGHKVDGEELDQCIYLTQKASEVNGNVPYYYEQLAKFYIAKKDKKQAQRSLKKAMEIGKIYKYDMKYYQAIERDIQKL